MEYTQTTIPPGQMEWAGEYNEWQIYRLKDGNHQAWRARGRKEKARPKDNGKLTTWNGTAIMGPIYLPSENYVEACAMLDRATRRPAPEPAPQEDPSATLFPELIQEYATKEKVAAAEDAAERKRLRSVNQKRARIASIKHGWQATPPDAKESQDK